MFPPPPGGAGGPCAGACDASALCVRSQGARGVACLCPDGLVPADADTDRNLRCVISRSALGEASSTGAPDDGSCSLACGAGACVRGAGGPRCECGPLYGGARCQHYRCARHCLHRGVCVLDPTPPPGADPPPLKCICVQGYSGSRCETPPPPPVGAGEGAGAGCAALRCANGGSCRQPGAAPHCVCPPHYYGVRCERCRAGPPCAAGALCSRGECRPDTCAYCLDRGTCVEKSGGVACECQPGWSGERCQRRACSDAACRQLGGGPNDVQRAESTDEADCESIRCSHGGRCVTLGGGGGGGGGGACACAGAWGGATCGLYVGHDHACLSACSAPALCVWGPDVSETEAGPTYCACPTGATCPLAPHAPAPAGVPGAPGPAGGAGGAWLGAALALLALGALGAALLYLLHRRRRGLFVHARLSDNVEISNPMYLAGEGEDDEPPSPSLAPAPCQPPPRALTNGGNHFANPVYESMYAPQQNMPIEEHASLLPPGAGRAALL